MFTKNVLKLSLIVTLLSVMVSSRNLNFSWTRFDLFKLIIPLNIVQIFFMLLLLVCKLSA